MDVEKLRELVGVAVTTTDVALTPEQVESVLTGQEFLQAAKRRGYVLGSVATTEATTTTDSPEAPAPVDLFSELTAEQQERARAKQTAFAEHFSTPERPLSPEDFGVVAVGDGEDRKVFVMLTTGNGLYKGSYDAIMDKKKANKAAFTVEVDGQTIDTRTAMTWDLYQAFINQAKVEAKTSGEPHTGTWLTGEEPDELRADYGDVYESGARRRWYYRDRGWFDLRVRPAAEV